ncbi:succinate dehydrogenase subunit D [Rhodothalassium salexigens DSM 2132]|uniref:Succinate dehydrogenase hydrophobic membrane anchor subunit n=1 Tax=Rhodothalassium salexigens DSM 2132 TaxID=1188247 RepID=A0A4R2PDV7_RHOSA|nr:succinate dehydrogenase, hydrophobic membrane anchor protein [Rhodothalassium salexigens]MBB4211996.1 succinate dehydrogenase / fumarate reductase membrane anchor subunit [Rhodothalassium salexigens DSM 2132]MBK1638518.1 succinate dehydrogenase, hydrophobic membrane anchor protein [Rhodothalassium salexigens DSM 2132]TCP33420.1 succinate dehydrogenase subunit D [Rhodothalassium salexigens DSM 2132]
MTIERTALARARGLGSAKSGTGHWWRQRVTAVINLVLVGWLIVSLVAMAGSSYDALVAWMRNPVVAALLILCVMNVFYHVRLGLQVVVEDYVHREWLKVALVILMTLVCAGLGLLGVVSVLQIALGA